MGYHSAFGFVADVANHWLLQHKAKRSTIDGIRNQRCHSSAPAATMMLKPHDAKMTKKDSRSSKPSMTMIVIATTFNGIDHWNEKTIEFLVLVETFGHKFFPA